LATDGRPTEVLLHVKAIIDGVNRLTLKATSALWEQTLGSPPESLTINDLNWDSQHHRLLPLPNDEMVLPAGVDYQSVWVEMIKGNGIVACEPSDDKVAVYVTDMSQHPQPYDFILHFSNVERLAVPHSDSTSAHLKISGLIDGSDRLTITHDGAKWEHLSWGPATGVALNNISWPLDKTPELKNEGPTQFLPTDVDFSTAKVISRSGRDLVTARGYKDKLVVYFGDTESGSDQYEIDVAFSPDF
jgi:hypothetical protein